MANIFKENKAVNEHPNRNNFDLSKKSNVSLKFGTLYPVYCQPVVPGDSFDINVAYNLKLMPVIFPVQTKMRAHMHFFYVRNKNLWSNWENWISNLPNATQDLTPHPYISRPDSEFASGSIHDFLGVPTSLVAHHIPNFKSDSFTSWGYFSDSLLSSEATIDDFTVPAAASWSSAANCGLCYFCPSADFINSVPDDLILRIPTTVIEAISNVSTTHVYLRVYTECWEASDMKLLADVIDLGTISHIVSHSIDGIYSFTLDSTVVASLKSLIVPDSTLNFWFNVIALSLDDNSSPVGRDPKFIFGYETDLGHVDYPDLDVNLYSSSLHINALPYRAYESIYWAFYNNNVVSPMIIDGQPQYNRYNTNLGDGADSTPYHLFQRNYELDFLTSSLPSPQQGVAPLVGMTALGDVTIEDENGITTAHAEIDNDGTITKVVLTSPAASVEHARTAMNIAASGMSINDFRQTNALQRLLETNIRKGYRYLDFIAGHFGKEPEYRELDMPEFIGGFSRDVNVSTVVSSADTLGDDSGKSLGSFGGFAQVVGGSQHSIRHYCDDYGYIIGIMSVVPTPCYSQLLSKHMIAPDNFLDYYFPEFSSSGLQAITYKEVAPIQSYLDSLNDPDKSLEDTFGYNRPNYDMVSAVDEVHGEFRGSLRNYVINRIFDSRPELGRDFLQINPSEINDIFVNTNPDDDTIIGEIGFSVHAKRPVPRVVIPNLGR